MVCILKMIPTIHPPIHFVRRFPRAKVSINGLNILKCEVLSQSKDRNLTNLIVLLHSVNAPNDEIKAMRQFERFVLLLGIKNARHQ